jgi:hypothetical protein
MKGKEGIKSEDVKPPTSSFGHVSRDVGSASGGELSQARLVNVRVLANKEFCGKVASALEPLGLVVTGFEEDPQRNPGIFRMFLAGRLRGS